MRVLVSAMLLPLAACYAGPNGLWLECAVHDSQPVLTWQSFPRPKDLSRDAQGLLDKATEVRYEVAIHGADGEPVYGKTAIEGLEHRVVRPLKPGRYYCTVRPWFRIDGALRVGVWSTRWPWTDGRVRWWPYTGGRVPLPVTEMFGFTIAR